MTGELIKDELMVTVPQQGLADQQLELQGLAAKCMEFIEENRILRQRNRELTVFLEGATKRLTAADHMHSRISGVISFFSDAEISDALNVYEEICRGPS
jgi:hypothetical protein